MDRDLRPHIANVLRALHDGLPETGFKGRGFPILPEGAEQRKLDSPFQRN